MEKEYIVYFLHTEIGRDNFVKIGRTTNLKQRIRSLVNGIPGEATGLFYYCFTSIEDSINVERFFLNGISHFRLNGSEWIKSTYETTRFTNSLDDALSEIIKLSLKKANLEEILKKKAA